MYSDRNLTILRPERQAAYAKPTAGLYPKHLRFLIIGSYDNDLSSFFRFFELGGFITSYKDAKNVLYDFNKQNGFTPDAIIIDRPFDEAATTDFSLFLKSKSHLAGVSLFYSKRNLSEQTMALLQKTTLVDDVIDLTDVNIDFAAKIDFINKTKSYNKLRPVRGEDKTTHTEESQKIPFLKRVFDILTSSILLLICLPIFVLIAIAIKLESRGPVFFVSSRAGRGFKVFNFFKFRSMEQNAEKNIDKVVHLNQYEKSKNGANFLKVDNDPRITKVGKFLRKTSLDELPQFINVLKGDMSIVGNRPLPIYEATTLTTNDCVERFMAPAGITGLWQVEKRGKANMSAEERVNLDITYARKFNVYMDLYILARTPFVLFQQCNA